MHAPENDGRERDITLMMKLCGLAIFRETLDSVIDTRRWGCFEGELPELWDIGESCSFCSASMWMDSPFGSASTDSLAHPPSLSGRISRTLGRQD